MYCHLRYFRFRDLSWSTSGSCSLTTYVNERPGFHFSTVLTDEERVREVVVKSGGVDGGMGNGVRCIRLVLLS